MALRYCPKKIYAQKYRYEWQRDSRMRDWLKAVQGDSSKAFCKFCHTEISAKLQVLLSHAATKSHMKNANMLGKAPQQEASLRTFFNNCNKKKTLALSLAVFICEHTSLNTANHLTSFFNKHAGTDIKMGRTKATNLIKNVLAPSYRRELVEALGNKPYSIIVDESTDVSSTKALGIIISYFNPSLGLTVNCFYRIVAVSKVDACSLTDAIFTCLREDGLNCDNIVGVGCDGASVMVGRHHSVSTLMREKIPHLLTVRCVCHSLHLAASYATGKLPSALEFLVSHTYSHFSRSAMRRDKYREIFREARGKDPLTFVRPANTRWLSLLEAITRIKDQWKQLHQYFRNVDNENSSADDSYSVRTLRNMYEDDRNYLWVSFLEQHLRPIVRLNEAFQSESADRIVLLKDLEELYMTFLSYVASSEGIRQAKIHKNLFTFDYTPFLKESLTVFLGSEFHSLEFQCFPQEEMSLARERGMYFLREMTDQLHKRLPDHTSMLPSFELLSPENVKRIDKFGTTIDGIKNLAAQFSTIGISPKESCEEWTRVGLIDWNCTRTDLGTFWKEIYEKTDAQDKRCFPNLSRLAAVLMALPISNAAVERMFSIMNIVKSKSRNRMAMNTCAAILEVRDAMRRNGVSCDTFVPTAEMLKNFKADIVYPKSVEDGSVNNTGEPDDSVSQIVLIEEEAILDAVRDAEARFNIHINIV